MLSTIRTYGGIRNHYTRGFGPPAFIVCNQTSVGSVLLGHGTSPKAIGRLGVGLDIIDLKKLTTAGHQSSSRETPTRLRWQST